MRFKEPNWSGSRRKLVSALAPSLRVSKNGRAPGALVQARGGHAAIGVTGDDASIAGCAAEAAGWDEDVAHELVFYTVSCLGDVADATCPAHGARFAPAIRRGSACTGLTVGRVPGDWSSRQGYAPLSPTGATERYGPTP